MAPLIGKEMTESVFLERFASLCVDPLFHVRKVFAANFGDFSNVVGCEATEQVLVSSQHFVKSSQHFVKKQCMLYCTITCRVLLNQPQHKIGQHDEDSIFMLTKCNNRGALAFCKAHS